MNLLFLIGVSCSIAYLMLLAIKTGLSLRYVRRHSETQTRIGSVTVLQPILGGDPSLPTALERNLQNAPAEAIFLWLVDESDAPGLEVTRRLRQQYADRVRLLECPPCPDGRNPKSFKLNFAFPAIETDYVAVLDDDTVLSPGHLSRAIASLDRCDLYTGLPSYVAGDSLGSSLVAQFVNNNSIVTYLSPLNWLPPLTINGMFYVLKRETLVRWQGWETITGELCDDYAFAKLARRHAARIHQGVTAQRLRTTITGPGQYFRQMHRWFVFAHVLVLDQPRWIQLQLLVFLGLPPVLLWGSLLTFAGGSWGIVMFAVLVVVRDFLLRTLQRMVVPDPPRFSWWRSLLSEWLQVVHDMHAWMSQRIVWRTRTIRVKRDGTFQTLNSA